MCPDVGREHSYASPHVFRGSAGLKQEAVLNIAAYHHSSTKSLMSVPFPPCGNTHMVNWNNQRSPHPSVFILYLFGREAKIDLQFKKNILTIFMSIWYFLLYHLKNI